jgi:D-alanine-D-alanine ligase
MPGFTSVSLFPQLWKSQGMSMEDLIKNLLNAAIEKYYRQQRLHHLPLP